MRVPLLALATVVAALPAVRAEPARSFLGKSAAEWAKELAEGGPPERRAAAFALGKLGDTSGGALDHLTNALTDGEAAVRDAAAFALGEVAAAGHEEAVWDRAGVLLRRSLGDGDWRVRRSAAFALGSCGAMARSAAAALAGALEDPEATVRRNAAWALGRVVKGSRDPAAVAKLVAVLGRSAEDALVLRDVAGALREIGKPGAAAAVRPLAAVFLSSRNPALRRAALTTLVGLVEPSLAAERPGSHRDLVRALLRALREGGPEQKALVAGALANLGDHAEPAVKDLAALAGDDVTPDEVRRNAVLALANAAGVVREWPEDEARPVVRKLAAVLKGARKDDARKFAAEALYRIGFPLIEAALPELEVAIRADPSLVVRQRAIWAFLDLDDLRRMRGVEGALLDILTGKDTSLQGKDPGRVKMVRYDAARTLAQTLRHRSPDVVIDTLERMLRDTEIRVYNQSRADVQGASESAGGRSKVERDLGGDARFMAAFSLAQIGRPARRPGIVEGLKQLVDSPDPTTRRHARDALRSIGQ